MEKEKKIYVGSGKTSNYGISISLCLDDMMIYADKNIDDYNGKKYIKLDVNEKREVDQYGKTHSVSINTWKPDREPIEQEPEDGQDISPDSSEKRTF